jgi:hypothetical protein
MESELMVHTSHYRTDHAYKSFNQEGIDGWKGGTVM